MDESLSPTNASVGVADTQSNDQSSSWTRSGSGSFYTNSGDYTNSRSYSHSCSYNSEEDSISNQSPNTFNDDITCSVELQPPSSLAQTTEKHHSPRILNSSSSFKEFLEENEREAKDEDLTDTEHQAQLEKLLAEEDHGDAYEENLSDIGGIEVTDSMGAIDSWSANRAQQRIMERKEKEQAMINEAEMRPMVKRGVNDTIRENKEEITIPQQIGSLEFSTSTSVTTRPSSDNMRTNILSKSKSYKSTNSGEGETIMENSLSSNHNPHGNNADTGIVGTHADADVDADAEANTKTEIEADTNADADHGADADVNTDVNANAYADTGVDVNSYANRNHSLLDLSTNESTHSSQTHAIRNSRFDKDNTFTDIDDPYYEPNNETRSRLPSDSSLRSSHSSSGASASVYSTDMSGAVSSPSKQSREFVTSQNSHSPLSASEDSKKIEGMEEDKDEVEDKTNPSATTDESQVSLLARSEFDKASTDVVHSGRLSTSLKSTGENDSTVGKAQLQQPSSLQQQLLLAPPQHQLPSIPLQDYLTIGDNNLNIEATLTTSPNKSDESDSPSKSVDSKYQMAQTILMKSLSYSKTDNNEINDDESDVESNEAGTTFSSSEVYNRRVEIGDTSLSFSQSHATQEPHSTIENSFSSTSSAVKEPIPHAIHELNPTITYIIPPPPPPPMAATSTTNMTTHTSLGPINPNPKTTQQITSKKKPKTRAKRLELGGRQLALGIDGVDGVNQHQIKNFLVTVRENIDKKLIQNQNQNQNENRSEFHHKEKNREYLRRPLPPSINSSNLANLAHKKWDRRRIAEIEISKTVKNLVQLRDFEMVRKIVMLLSDEYVMSTNEDARKGGVKGLATCAVGLRDAKAMVEDEKKKVDENMSTEREMVEECKDLILANVVHACQDNSHRVRYYAMESLTSVIKILPSLAVEYFFILFEILRALWADVDTDVMNQAELLDTKFKEIIVSSINKGQFTADACIPLFARYVHMNNRPTRRLTLTWLQKFSDTLVGEPLLEFLHLFLCDIFVMLADPNPLIKKESYDFLSSIQPKLLSTRHPNDNVFEDAGGDSRVDFDKILQNLVTTMEHPDPFVRKVAMHWVSKIVQAHIVGVGGSRQKDIALSINNNSNIAQQYSNPNLSTASISVRNSLPHVLPGILLSIGDTTHPANKTKDTTMLESTQVLAEQTNQWLQNAVKEEGKFYIAHLDAFIVALREELDTHCRGNKRRSKRKPSVNRNELYRKDAKLDGTGIESVGWFIANSNENNELGEEVDKRKQKHKQFPSLNCALDWIIILFEAVVPELLRDEYAEEFIKPIVRLFDDASENVIFKSLEVLAKITLNAAEDGAEFISKSTSLPKSKSNKPEDDACYTQSHPMTNANATFALGILDVKVRQHLSRSRSVFAALIESLALNNELLLQLPRIICHMCTLQPPEFIFVSFGLELEKFVYISMANHRNINKSKVFLRDDPSGQKARQEEAKVNRDLDYVTKFVQILMNVFLSNDLNVKPLRDTLKNCISQQGRSICDERKAQLFHILLNTFSHDVVSALTLCIWCGAFRTANTYLHGIDPLDMDLMFFLSLDRFVQALEGEPFRDLHIRMLECEEDPGGESSGAMLFGVLRSILMLLPQSTSFGLLRERLVSLSRFRQCAVCLHGMKDVEIKGTSAEVFAHRIFEVRKLHCDARWRSIRAESLEPFGNTFDSAKVEESKRSWLGYVNEEEEKNAKEKYQWEKAQRKRGGKGTEHGDGRDDSVVHEYEMLHVLNDFNTGSSSIPDASSDVTVDGDSDGNIIANKVEGFSDKSEPYSETKTNEIIRKASEDSSHASREEKEKWKEYWAEADSAQV